MLFETTSHRHRMSKIHWHLENIPEAIKRQSIEKVVTVKLDVDVVRIFGRYHSEVENWNKSWVLGQCRDYRKERWERIFWICVFEYVFQQRPMEEIICFFKSPSYGTKKFLERTKRCFLDMCFGMYILDMCLAYVFQQCPMEEIIFFF